MQPDANNRIDKTNKKLDVIIKYIKLLSIIIVSVVFIWQLAEAKTVFFDKVNNKVDRDSLESYKKRIDDKFDDNEDNQRLIVKQLVNISKKLGVEIDEDIIDLTKKSKSK